jgi:2,3-bisphosphoglycerate-independent phosphoglycerate mutase
MQNKAMLIVLDGWGIGPIEKNDAIASAHTPFIHSLYEKYPHSKLLASGEAVGLPNGQMGNSEVGHLNLGAGRVVYQEFQRINEAIRKNELKDNAVLNQAFKIAKEKKVKLHFVGLVSNGGVHSHVDHLKALCTYASEAGVSDFAVHAFTDGRDCDPKSGVGFIKELQSHLDTTGGKIAAVVGRFFAMDRDHRWERIFSAYDAMVNGKGKKSSDAYTAIQESYTEGVTDEFLKPIILCNENNEPVAKIKDGDVVVCFNFRTDRCREITEVLTQKDVPEFSMHKLNLNYFTMTEYDKTYKGVEVIFENKDIKDTLGEVLEKNNKTQLRISETEKYPHVTFFFSGGRELPFVGEKRIMVPSVCTVETYDQKCEMCACEITDAVIPGIKSKEFDFICMNLANADMVGHTGVWKAIIGAVETVDICLSKIVPEALKAGYGVFITGDHGNAEGAINADGTPNTAHTTNPVPLIIADDYTGKILDGKLGDVAPTILKYMGLEVPKEMTGNILIEDK